MEKTAYWENLNILVTGGTGSFGNKFADIILQKFKPKKLIIFSRDELKQHEMRMGGLYNPSLRFFIGDVRDIDRLRRAMDGVDYVVHAAALKQVPSCEYNPFEAVKTNVYGAQNVIDAAIDMGVKKVVAISTDKAVNPVNLYGATKLCAEKIFTQGNAYVGDKGTCFSCVRYGNVIGSRGSVIPLFLKQRLKGKVTITDIQMTRFWLSLEDAVDIVIKAFKHMQGGEIFVPQISSMKIVDLAKSIAPDCSMEIIGMRPGEKLHEVLITPEDGRNTVEYDGFYIILPQLSWWERKNYKSAVAVTEGFSYTSDNNVRWLSVKQIKALVKDFGDSGGLETTDPVSQVLVNSRSEEHGLVVSNAAFSESIANFQV